MMRQWPGGVVFERDDQVKYITELGVVVDSVEGRTILDFLTTLNKIGARIAYETTIIEQRLAHVNSSFLVNGVHAMGFSNDGVLQEHGAAFDVAVASYAETEDLMLRYVQRLRGTNEILPRMITAK
jgi:hypothetical protein